MNDRKIHRLFQKLQKAIPEPITELRHHNPFELLISVILSAQATDKSVNLVTPTLFEKISDTTGSGKRGERAVLAIIKTIGLAKTKAANIVKTSRILAEQHDSSVPHNREQLEGLPGVGRKTANIHPQHCFWRSVIAVDTHVLRVANRIGLASANKPEKVEEQLMEVIPRKWKKDAHHYLVLHGRYVCKARKPDCLQCRLRGNVNIPKKQSEERQPALSGRTSPKQPLDLFFITFPHCIAWQSCNNR